MDQSSSKSSNKQKASAAANSSNPVTAGSTIRDAIESEEDIVGPLLRASNSSDLRKALDILIAKSRTDDGRSSLSDVLPAVLRLARSLSYSSGDSYLKMSLRLLRNLCAGEIANQNLFIQHNGVGILLAILCSAGLKFNLDVGLVRAGLQVLANVGLAGEEHQRAIWDQLFPVEFHKLAKIRSQETCDPLCMIIYICCDGIPCLLAELCSDRGLQIVAEIVRTASIVGFREDWLKILLSRICLEDVHFPELFSKLYCSGDTNDGECFDPSSNCFSAEQAYLLGVISEIVNERIVEMTVNDGFAFCILGIFKRSVEVVDFTSRNKSGLPTGSTNLDVLGYSIAILRDMCSRLGEVAGEEDTGDVVNMLLSHGLLESFLYLLRDLEPPSIIRKAMKQSENEDAKINSNSRKLCPYKGFRRDIVAVIGNCTFRRKHVQDQIRQKKAILLLLQQCVTDEDNPFLREWGIWCVRNLLEGNAENQQAVAELELQGSVDMPELSGLGLRVEVDQKTQRAKLVNISSSCMEVES